MQRRRVKKRKKGPEAVIQKNIIEVLTYNRCSVFRGNVGKVRTPDGRFFSTGLPNGFPDLFGWRWSDKQIFFIEVKAPKGRISQAQQLYHLDLMHKHVLHGIARSVEDEIGRAHV